MHVACIVYCVPSVAAAAATTVGLLSDFRRIDRRSNDPPARPPTVPVGPGPSPVGAVVFFSRYFPPSFRPTGPRCCRCCRRRCRRSETETRTSCRVV